MIYLAVTMFLMVVDGHTVHNKNVLLSAEEMRKVVDPISRTNLKSVDPMEFDESLQSPLTDFFQQERDISAGVGWGQCWANTEPKLKCVDGTEWIIPKHPRGGVLSNWTKCGERFGGRLLCPSTWPYMCHDHFCVQHAEGCYAYDGGHGGLRRCTNAPPNYIPTSSPTASPTTSPTTASPTTSPTTASPTTSPTTASPTTSPTTASPTTASPTPSPTTPSPTTLSPTSSPTTPSPTTLSPTSSPTTPSPTAAPTKSPGNCWTNAGPKLKCSDGTDWLITKPGGVLSNWTQCGSRKGGRLLCPSTWPYMCRDHFCMKKTSDCYTLHGGHGGPRPCYGINDYRGILPKDNITHSSTSQGISKTLAPAAKVATPVSKVATPVSKAATLPKNLHPHLPNSSHVTNSLLCGGVTCEDVILRFHNPCHTTWKEGCGTVPAPHGFHPHSTMFNMCPHLCPGKCVDLEWQSSSKRGCDFYEKMKWCSNGTYGPGWKHNFYGNFSKWADVAGIDASRACCACGGGRNIPPGLEKEVDKSSVIHKIPLN